jgi:translation initiation factor IF-3
MRISRKRRPKQQASGKKFQCNYGIKVPEVLVLDEDGSSLGVMETIKAIKLAEEKEMDLVEINPKASPPVAKIADFGQWQYQQEKVLRIKKAHQKLTKIKGVRLSLRIGQSDLEIRKKHTMDFLDEGHKVKIEVILKGRENQHANLAVDALKNFIAEIEKTQVIRYDQEIERQGRSITATIARV